MKYRLESPRSRRGQIQCLVRAHFLVHCLAVSSQARGGSFLGPFLRVLIPFTWTLASPDPHCLITSLRPHFQIPSHWGLGFCVWTLRGHRLPSKAALIKALYIMWLKAVLTRNNSTIDLWRMEHKGMFCWTQDSKGMPSDQGENLVKPEWISRS